MQINNVNNTPNFGQLIITPEAKRTLKRMSSSYIYKTKANKILSELLEAKEHLKNYNWSDVIVHDKGQSRIPKFSFYTLLTAPLKGIMNGECYRKNAVFNKNGKFSSTLGDVVEEENLNYDSYYYDFRQSEEQSSLKMALKIADKNEELGNKEEKKKYKLTINDKLKKLGIV